LGSSLDNGLNGDVENERKPVYRDAIDRQRFLERLEQVVTAYRITVHGYVLAQPPRVPRGGNSVCLSTLASRLTCVSRSPAGARDLLLAMRAALWPARSVHPVRRIRALIYDLTVVGLTAGWYQTVLERLPLDCRLLDIGIGTGGALLANAELVVRKRLRITGVDVDSAYVERCNRECGTSATE
jgi:hypothetical protein